MRKLIAVTILIVVTGSLSWGGPVVIDGTDANDIGHGSSLNGTNVDGWLYMQKVLERLSSQLDPSVAKVVVDLGTHASSLFATNSQARDAINSAFSQSSLPAKGWSLVHIEGTSAIETWLTTLSTANTGILYIPTASETDGDLTDAELTVINSHSAEINNFVGGNGNAILGGALYAMGESPVGGAVAYGWLVDLLPSVAVTDVGGGGVFSTVTLTPDGETAFPGLTSADLSTGPWHNHFTGDFGGLLVLATAPDFSGVTQNVIIGGGAGTTFQLSGQCVTRPARYWFTHADNPDLAGDVTTATLLNALKANSGGINVGFVTLPHEFQNGDGVKDVNDALMEALSFFYQKPQKSTLCKERWRLAAELIAATANFRLLGSSPSACTYFDGVNVTNFPSTLLQQARTAGAGDDVAEIRSVTALLEKFNNAGQTNNLPVGLAESSPQKKKTLRKLARNPTTPDSCPGANSTCATAEAVVFQNSGPFGSAIFRRSVNLNSPKYTDSIQSPSCGVGGRDVIWKVTPTVGTTGRPFTVVTDGSNFDTMISVWTGICSNLVEVTSGCVNNAGGVGGESLSFNTDGTSTYRIVVEGPTGNYGKLKLKITSP